jgi:3-deoxy-D-manno-octulosonic-acid transferase
MQNFQVLVRDLLRHQGAIQVPTPEDLAPTILSLQSDPTRKATLVANGQAILARHLGATDRTCDVLDQTAGKPRRRVP